VQGTHSYLYTCVYVVLQHIDLDFTYTDTLSMALSTSLLLNYPTAQFARLPISLTLSLSILSGTVQYSLLPPRCYHSSFPDHHLYFRLISSSDNTRTTFTTFTPSKRIIYTYTHNPSSTKFYTLTQSIFPNGISCQTCRRS